MVSPRLNVVNPKAGRMVISEGIPLKILEARRHLWSL